MKSLSRIPNPEVLMSFGQRPDIAIEQGAWGRYRFRAYDRNADGEVKVTGMGETLDEAVQALLEQYE